MARLARLKQRLRARLKSLPWFRAGPRDAQPLRIVNRRIYVMPSQFGLFIGLSLAALNLGSLNYNNNAALLLGFVVISLCNNALIGGHLSLLGLQLRSQAPAPVFAGKSLQLQVAITPRSPEPQAFSLRYDDCQHSFTLGPEETTATLSIATTRRGAFYIDRISLNTLQPLGLARAWCYLNLHAQVWVYPQPAGQPLHAWLAVSEQGQGRRARQKTEQPHHLREYRHGDSRKQIAWKASARSGQLQVREYEPASADDLLLDWAQLAHLEYEARISQLCLWVLQAEQKQRRYGLNIPGTQIAVGTGEAHQRQCLEALAGMPHGH
jgi:uncharacterized protein (DUF58 family)